MSSGDGELKTVYENNEGEPRFYIILTENQISRIIKNFLLRTVIDDDTVVFARNIVETERRFTNIAIAFLVIFLSMIIYFFISLIFGIKFSA
jgi:hypothetical protein